MIRAVGVETGGSNIQFAVNPADRRDRGDRDEPARVALLGAGLQGHRLPDRQDRRAAGRGLRAGGDRQRHHPRARRPASSPRSTTWWSSGRASRSRSSPAPTARCPPTCSRWARRWRSGAPSSRPSSRRCARASSTCTPAFEGDLLRAARDALARPLRAALRGRPRAAHSRRSCAQRTGIDPWFMAEIGALARGEDPQAGPRAHLQGGRHLRRRVRGRDALLLLGLGAPRRAHEVRRGERPSVVILGCGPNRIGQGIEFDYCCVHAAMTVRESGRDAVMVNCNPETVSTDYDTSDRLYFEPLTLEDVLGVIELEQPGGRDRPVRRPDAAEAGRRAWPTPACRCSARPVESIHLAEDRPSFGALLDELGLQGPALRHRRARPRRRSRRPDEVGYPLLVRPSYVLGGRAMEICYSRDGLADYLRAHRTADGGRRTIFLDRFLENAIEVDVDALCDGEEVRIGAIMQHVEEAGVHSGDSACVIPAMSLGPEMLAQVRAGHRGDRAAAGRGRADQHPVRRLRRRGAVRDRGQPARLAHGAVRVQGDRRAAGQGGLPADAGRAAGRHRPRRRAARRATCRSRRRCCRSAASRAPTPCWARR